MTPITTYTLEPFEIDQGISLPILPSWLWENTQEPITMDVTRIVTIKTIVSDQQQLGVFHGLTFDPIKNTITGQVSSIFKTTTVNVTYSLTPPIHINDTDYICDIILPQTKIEPNIILGIVIVFIFMVFLGLFALFMFKSQVFYERSFQ